MPDNGVLAWVEPVFIVGSVVISLIIGYVTLYVVKEVGRAKRELELKQDHAQKELTERLHELELHMTKEIAEIESRTERRRSHD